MSGSAAGARRARVLVAMSGGVDSSVAAARLLDAGYDVAGVTMKLWGGPSDTGCCSVSDVDDARWVADELGIEHHVFNFGDDFERHVVAPYVADHAAGRTPNPCVECNRHIKFSRLMRRADALGFELVATGHHARIVVTADGPRIARGADAAKDQSYVLHMLDAPVLNRLLLPVGEMTKDEVRHQAQERGLVTAAKPDSQDVCFITAAAGRPKVPQQPDPPAVGSRRRHRRALEVGAVEALELVTVGQRRGPGAIGHVDHASLCAGRGRRLSHGHGGGPGRTRLLDQRRWITGAGRDGPAEGPRGGPDLRSWQDELGDGLSPTVPRVRWAEPRRAVAPGQSVVAYRGDIVVGGGTAGRAVSQLVP